jgi:hypothetical protein
MQLVGLLLLSIGFFVTISSYGFLYLFAYVPMSLFWGYFWGFPPLIGIMKVSDTFAPGEFWGTVVVQIIFICLLLGLCKMLGMNQIVGYVVAAGLANGAAMPASSLRAERDQSNSKK